MPEGGDFGSDKMFALDADLDELHAIDFDKGCYVGQELTARMKHRGTARKRLLAVESAGRDALAAGASCAQTAMPSVKSRRPMARAASRWCGSTVWRKRTARPSMRTARPSLSQNRTG